MDYAYKVTTNGRAVLAALMGLEKPFHVTRVAFGSGRVDEDANLADVHGLLEYVSDGAVAERSHKDDRFNLTIQYANGEHKDVPTFLLSEFIVYVENPVTEEETDFIYGTLGDYRQPVPAYNPAYPPSVFNFPLTTILSDEINVAVSAPAGLATWEDLERVATIRQDIVIPAEGWGKTGEGTYPFRLEIPVKGCTEKMIPGLTILEEGEAAANLCGLAPRVQTLYGAVQVSAVSVPDAPIPASLTLQGDASGLMLGVGGDGEYTLPPATENRLGGVKVGQGLNVSSDGTLSVDSASGAEVEEMLTGVFGPDNK